MKVSQTDLMEFFILSNPKVINFINASGVKMSYIYFSFIATKTSLVEIALKIFTKKKKHMETIFCAFHNPRKKMAILHNDCAHQ
jgi:hypothetical protein